MPMPTDEDIQRMHRYFAVQCNNDAWELAELAERTVEQNEEMVCLAEVAAWHWSKVGQPINFARADMLSGWVCFIVGRADDACAYTKRVRKKLDELTEEASPWDEAFLALLETRTLLSGGDQSDFDAAAARLDSVREKLHHDGERDAFDSYRASMTP